MEKIDRKKKMKVSIIVPVYNVEKYIEKCIMSIMNQTLRNFECLVVDDGSKDDSIEIVKKIIGKDNRFIILSKENGGLSDARNYGLDKANGEYICFIDSDDYVDKNLLLLTYEKAKEYDSDITCFDLYYDYGNNNYKISKGADYHNVSSYKDNKEIIFNNNSANNKLYKREFLKKRRFVKGMWYEDMAVIPVWIAEANNMSYVDKPLYYYVQRKGSISHSANPKLFDIYLAISMIKKSLKLSSYDVRKLYFNNCLVMTILRIKEIDDKVIRTNYYKENIERLNNAYPEWYHDLKKEKGFTFKQSIIFYLLKHNRIKVLDYLYN